MMKCALMRASHDVVSGEIILTVDDAVCWLL